MPDPKNNFNFSLIPQNQTILVGLSGGPDSIYLLHQLHNVYQAYSIKIIAVHINHEWQATAQQAVDLCIQTCKKLGISLIIKKRSELPSMQKWNGSLEEIGRDMRRYFFSNLAQELNASAVFLGHHQQDQQETFFIRLLRGSCITGLTGMKSHDQLYVRPMLNCTKEEILQFLDSRSIEYYTDPTNTSDTFLRNKIRNHVIPTLQQTDSRFTKNLQATMEYLTKVDNYLDNQVEHFLHSHKTEMGLPISLFLHQESILQHRILLKLLIIENIRFTPSQNLFKEIIKFLEKSNNNKHILYNSWMIKKEKQHFFIQKIKISHKTL